jgi:hypothetical protein
VKIDNLIQTSTGHTARHRDFIIILCLFKKQSRPKETSLLMCHTSKQCIADLPRSLLYMYNTSRTAVGLLVYACIDKATAILSPCPNPLVPPTHSDYLPHYRKEFICGPDISTYWKRIYFSISSFIQYFSFHKVPFYNLVETICCFRLEPSKFFLFFCRFFCVFS